MRLVSSSSSKTAIIGAGAGGSSLAYFLNSSSEATVFEQSARVGGRARHLEWEIPVCGIIGEYECKRKNFVIELGASVFASTNRHLKGFVTLFNLTAGSSDNQFVPSDARLGIWNGNEFLLYLEKSESTIGWIWTNLKVLWRYGYSPISAQKICKELVEKFLKIYSILDLGFGWRDNAAVMGRDRLDLEYAFSSNCKDHLLKKGVSEAYIDEMIGSISRNIYLSDAADLHLLACNVALYAASNEVFSVSQGNSKIYEQLLQHSGSTLKMQSRVTAIEKKENGKYRVYYEDVSVPSIPIAQTDEFDNVVFAVPLPKAASEIELLGEFKSQLYVSPSFEYVKLYVTVVYGQVDPSYFGIDSVFKIPTQILTPASSSSPFNCFATRLINSSHSISKYFSTKPLLDEFLQTMFVEIVQVHRENWDQPGSYPYLPPSSLDNLPAASPVDEGIYFVNTFERLLSTMETETVAARNIALLIAERMAERKSSSIGKQKPMLQNKPNIAKSDEL